MAARINNAVYDALGERWYSAQDDPVALLRAEATYRVPWLLHEMAHRCGPGPLRVVDLGCGAGFVANELARHGHEVTGVDASEASLAVAGRYDETRSVRYVIGDVRQVPLNDGVADVVCAMDLLEHVDDPAAVIAEASRLLKPSGVFFFHTFNRSWLAWLVVIQGVRWFVRNTPANLHVLHLFLRPSEVQAMAAACGLRVEEMRGFEPVLFSRAFLRLLVTRVVPKGFAFRFTRSTRIAYSGLAVKQAAART
jgi:2-polyprenyl-6-hydroxyphenyl methylase/3-demethylubiquinone-9 3-methyltransferase